MDLRTNQINKCLKRFLTDRTMIIAVKARQSDKETVDIERYI